MKVLSPNMKKALELAKRRRAGRISTDAFHAGTLKALCRRGLLLWLDTDYRVEYLRDGNTRHHWTTYYLLTDAGRNA